MNTFLKGILDGIFSLVNNYGLSIVLFTILVRLCLMPLDYKSRVGMRKISKLAPKQQELQKKYEKDPEKMQRKLAELYKKENCSPMSSCWPMLVSMPILFAMFAAMRMMANEQLVEQAFGIILSGGTDIALEPFLWIKNLWMPDSPFNASLPTLQSLQMIPTDDWLTVFNALPAEQVAQLSAALPFDLTADAFAKDSLSATIEAIAAAMSATEGYAAQTASVPYLTINLLITQLTVVKNWNGLFLLPLLSAGSQYLMTVLNPAQQQPQPTGKDGQAQPNTGNFMKWFFPLFSLWICAGYNAAFALYWVTSNLIAMAQNFAINKYLDHKEAVAAQLPAGADKDATGIK
ncbi:MAG: membrane protein insertase YidC [Clostridia bacterium]|nr:membrane protein insertase YidC [Clostridia bacterium]